MFKGLWLLVIRVVETVRTLLTPKPEPIWFGETGIRQFR